MSSHRPPRSLPQRFCLVLASFLQRPGLPFKPEWMDQQTYDRMPASIEVRILHFQVDQPGFRVESLVIVATLTDSGQYAKDDITQLYHYRWQAELTIRSIKITMGMDVLRCKTPRMVHSGDVDLSLGLQSEFFRRCCNRRLRRAFRRVS